MFPKKMISTSFMSVIKPNSLCLLCSSMRNFNITNFRNHNAASSLIDENKSKIFFSREAQMLMKKVTGFDLEKIYRKKALGGKLTPPKYEFMTDTQLKEAQEHAIRKAYYKLQMPPIIPLNKEEIEVLDEEPRMIGFTRSKYVFTDISFNVSDKQRIIIVREPDGVLRKALSYERHRMSELYFPREGRSYEHPPMFQKENLKPLLKKKDYEFILDRACLQFEPDTQEFHDTIFLTFDTINENKDFDKLRSSRHFGPMAFYLCLIKDVNKLLEENLETERFEDAVDIAKLYCVVHPDSKFNSSKKDTENHFNFLQKFIESECRNPDRLLQLVDTYRPIKENPLHQNG